MQNIAQSIFKYETTILYSFKIQISNNNKKKHNLACKYPISIRQQYDRL